MNNNHTQIIPEAVLESVQSKIDAAIEELAPYVTSLTPQQRKGMPKMGEKSIGFVEKAYDFSIQNPSFRPPYLDMEQFFIDKKDAISLWTLLNKAQQLEQNISDTEMQSGSEAYQASLIFYNATKSAVSANVSGAKAVYDELRHRFPNYRKKSTE